MTTFRILWHHEWRVLWRERSLPIALALLLLFLGYALVVGLKTVGEAQAVAEAVSNEETTRLARLRKQLAGMATDTSQIDMLYSNPADPSRVGSQLGGRYAVLPTTPLAALSLGQLDLIPQYLRVTSYARITFAEPATVANPWKLLNGHIDASFVVIYLLPLLIIALSHDLLSGERERGSLNLLLAQGISLRIIVVAKLVVRVTALIVPMLAVVLLTVVVVYPDARLGLGGLMGWLLAALAYSLFWFGLALVVNQGERASASNGIALLSIWTVTVLVLPVSINLLAISMYPVPSRIEAVTAMREADKLAERQYGHLNKVDHYPEQIKLAPGKVYIHDYMMMTYLKNEVIAGATDPWMALINERLSAQQNVVERLALLSPAVLVNDAFLQVAGTDAHRQRHFQRLVDEFHAESRAFFYPRVYDSRAMTDDDYESIPRFHWREENTATVRQRLLESLLPMCFLAIAIFGFGLFRLRPRDLSSGTR